MRNYKNYYQRGRNKCGNKKVIFDGIEFDSQREACRYNELKILERSGAIENLELQKKYLLIPAQYETVETGEYYKIGAKKGQPKTKEVCIEQSLVYNADFVYNENGKTVVEDAKGFRDPASAVYAKFVIKRKLMLHIYGIRIREI